MDVPISVMQWEVFLPEQYKVKDFGGDTIAVNLLPVPMIENSEMQVAGTLTAATLQSFAGIDENQGMDRLALFVPGAAGSESMPQGTIGGVITDPSGAVVSGAQVKVTSVENGMTRTTTTDDSGRWIVSGMPSGRVRIEAAAQGFKTALVNGTHAESKTGRVDLRLTVADVSTTVEVTASAPLIETSQ